MSGGGSFSPGSTSFKKVYNAGAAGAVSVKAHTTYWSWISGATKNADDELISTVTSGVDAATSARLTTANDAAAQKIDDYRCIQYPSRTAEKRQSAKIQRLAG